MPGVLSRLAGSLRTQPRAVAAAAYGLLVTGAGVVAGVLWYLLAPAPSYLVDEARRATISERDLASIAGADAWYVAVGAVVGLVAGLLTWWRFRGLGPVVVLLAMAGGLVAGLVAWWVGTAIGPGEFKARLAAAQPGDRVPVDLELRARSALLVWPFAAVVPTLLGASLGRDEEPDPQAAAPGSDRDGG